MSLLKRSVINRSVGLAREVFARLHCHLPPFANWTRQDWDRSGSATEEIRACRLGWDVTDFGAGCFERIGRTLFTLRNGRADQPGYPKPYAEKYILDPEGQRAPAHFHRTKREDIINRGGGNLLVQLTAAGVDDRPSPAALAVQVDGCAVTLAAGGILRLRPGMSVCIPPRTIHQFWGEEGTGLRVDGVGYTVSGEVSTVCDDFTDNFFLEPMERFPPLDEDEPPLVYLCQEYPVPQTGELDAPACCRYP